MNVCLFDIDGTLINSGGAGKAAMEAALRSAFGLTQVKDGVPFSGRTDRAIARDLFALHNIEDGPREWSVFVADYLNHLPRTLREYVGRVLPGIDSLMANLSKRPDVATGLLTGNLRDGARIKLTHYRLHRHFAFGGFGDHHLDRDDVAREALTAVRGHLQGPPVLEKLWIIGDTPLDIRCARAIGARVAAVATGWHSWDELMAAEPDVMLRDFQDPGPLLAALS
jgi:phosphoglycolate phosphatase-like HAD superfamily hydrolase